MSSKLKDKNLQQKVVYNDRQEVEVAESDFSAL